MATDFGSFSWPSSEVGSNPSVGLNGQPIPTSSTEVGAEDPSGNLAPLHVDNSGNLLVSLAADPIDPLGVNLTEVGGAAVSLGQKTEAASIPVTIASDQSAVPVSGTVTANQGTPGVGAWPTLAAQSGTWNINNVSGTVSLPTGASTSALQTTGNTSLSSIDGKLATLGQKNMAGSEPVVIASDQSSIPVTIAAGSAVIGHVITDTGSTTAVTQATAANLNATVVQATGTNLHAVIDSGTITAATLDVAPSSQNITVVDSGSSTATGYNNQSLITGTPTAGSAASFVVGSKENIAVEIKGTWTGTLQFEVSIDGGTTWTPHGVHQFGSPNFVVAVTNNFIASLNMASKTNFRVRATAAVTGTATIQVVESANASTVYIANSLKLIDSTASANPTGMTIKAGSTAPVAGDSAIVVSLSPNSSGSVRVAGSAKANDPTFNSNSSNNITTSAYLQLVASTTSAATAVEVYNQSASSIYFAIGAAASELNQFIIPPGGNGRIPFTMAASTRVSVKAVDVNATTGSLIVNYWT